MEEDKELQIQKEINTINIVNVTNQAELEIAVELQKQLKLKRADVVKYWEPEKERTHAAWKGIVAKEKEMLDKIDPIIEKQKNSINGYLAEQERIRQDEIKKAEEERIAKEKKEKEKLDKKIEKAELEGNTEKAELLKDRKEAVVVSTPIPEKRVEKVSGMGIKKELKYEVVNQGQFLKALINMPNPPMHLITVKDADLKRWLKANGIKQFTGLRIFEGVSSTVRTK